MVKAEAGIVEGADVDEVEAKLAVTVREAVGADDAGWVLAHLRPVVGLDTGAELGADRRAEAFAAWRRYFEGLGEDAPLALAFDDLQWADDACWTSSTTWPTGPPACRCCWSAPAVRALRAPSRMGRGQAQRDHHLAGASLGSRTTAR